MTVRDYADEFRTSSYGFQHTGSFPQTKVLSAAKLIFQFYPTGCETVVFFRYLHQIEPRSGDGKTTIFPRKE